MPGLSPNAAQAARIKARQNRGGTTHMADRHLGADHGCSRSHAGYRGRKNRPPEMPAAWRQNGRRGTSKFSTNNVQFTVIKSFIAGQDQREFRVGGDADDAALFG